MSTKPFFIVVNPTGSNFARALQGALRERVVNSVYRRATPKTTRTIISRRGNVLRRGETLPFFAVTPRTLNKVQQFERFAAAGVSCPAFTTDVQRLDELESKTIFARTLINSTNGRGIVEFNYPNDTGYPRAPLYTAYVPKKAEYRFHVFGDKVIDVQEKRKKRGFDDTRNTRVRNVHNGYVYCRDGVNPPSDAADLAIRAVAACGYEYGAVDLIYNEKRGKCYVLEVNSRPGLMGSTLESYAKALINKHNLRTR